MLHTSRKRRRGPKSPASANMPHMLVALGSCQFFQPIYELRVTNDEMKKEYALFHL
jgi:hypothetical protein